MHHLSDWGSNNQRSKHPLSRDSYSKKHRKCCSFQITSLIKKYKYKQPICLLQKPEIPIATNPEKSNLAEAQEKDFKIAIMKYFKNLKEDVNKCLNEGFENTNSRLE